MGSRHSSVDSFAPSILPPRVQVPSTPSTLLSPYNDLCHEEKTKKQKEAGISAFKKWISMMKKFLLSLILLLNLFFCACVFLIKPLAIDMRKKFKEIIDRLSPVSEATVNCSTYLQLLFYGLLFWLQNTNSSGADVISKIYSSLARPG